jgi:hypothetical protein
MLRFLIIAAMLIVPTFANAQDPADALKTCVVDNTSGRDRKDLAKWFFFALAAYPELKQYMGANVEAATDDSAQKMAALLTRLLAESCVSEVKAAEKTGQGSQAVRIAFEAVGQLAAQELMSDKNVQATMGLVERYVDSAKLHEALSDK